MDVDNTAPIVCVTGVSGFLGSWCALRCLKAGFRVRGTVRSTKNPEKVKHLMTPDFKGLELFEADLLKDGTFDKAFTGATYVMHTASPFHNPREDAQKELIDPAVKGTTNVLNCALKAKCMKVVVTSSCAAIQTQDTFRTPEKFKGHVFTEKDWNLSSTLTEGAYRMSKTEAEKVVWNFHKSNRDKIDITVINPSFIVGPPQSTRIDSTSVKVFVEMMNGAYAEKGFGNACFGCVDVRDVAQAHFVAMLSPSANGERFVCSSNRSYTHMDFAVAIKERCKDIVSKGPAIGDKMPVPPKYQPTYSNQKSREMLGMSYNDPLNAIAEEIQFIYDNKLIAASK